MKAIMISIKPEWVEKILNREKTIEVRKKFPKDYVGWVYIYCTKKEYPEITLFSQENEFGGYIEHTGNGKVVARFWCDKVEEIVDYGSLYLVNNNYPHTNKVAKESCLKFIDLKNYLKGSNGYAIHISDLEIFDRPKEISEFHGAFTHKRYERIFGNNAIELDKKYGGLRQSIKCGYEYTYPLTKAPQSWCYVEELE